MAENSVRTAMSRRGAGRPFKPGQSDNPGGRPKHRALTDALEQMIDNVELAEKLWALALPQLGIDLRPFPGGPYYASSFSNRCTFLLRAVLASP